MDESLIPIIKALYDGSRSSVLLNNKVEFLNIYLEKMVFNTLEDHKSSGSIGGRPTSNLRFADDIDLIAGSNN